MSNTLYPAMASPAARLIAVVLFPTPPFWLVMEMIIWVGYV